MLYAVHNEDGQIYHSAKVYDVPAMQYDKQLSDMGQMFVKSESAGLLPPDLFYVNMSVRELRERPELNVVASKPIFKCGDKDSTVLTGFPKNSRCTIWSKVLNTVIYPEFVIDAEELEISIPVPCTYEVWFDYWPYKTCKVLIQAVP